MGDLIVLLVELEIVLRLGPEHGVDQPGEVLLVFIQGFQTVDHLLAGEVVVHPVHVVHGRRIHAHVGADQLPVGAVAAGGLPQNLRHLVVGVDDAPLQKIGIGDAAELGVPVDFPFGHLLGVQHVQGDLEHTAGDHIFVTPVVMLLAGDGVVVTEGHKIRICAVFGHEGLHHLFPGLVLEAFVALLRKGGGEQTQQNTERRRKAEQFFHQLHIISVLLIVKHNYFIIIQHIFKRNFISQENLSPAVFLKIFLRIGYNITEG